MRRVEAVTLRVFIGGELAREAEYSEPGRHEIEKKLSRGDVTWERETEVILEWSFPRSTACQRPNPLSSRRRRFPVLDSRSMSWSALQTLASILFGAGLTVLTATLLGRTLLARLFGAEPLLTRAEGWAFSLATGAALLSQGIFLLCALGLVYDETFLFVSAVVVGMWWRWGRGLPACPPPCPEQDARIWWVLLATVAAAYAYIYVPHALAPEIQADAAAIISGSSDIPIERTASPASLRTSTPSSRKGPRCSIFLPTRLDGILPRNSATSASSSRRS